MNKGISQRGFVIAAAFAAATMCSATAVAQSYPSKSIRMLLPQPPGAGVDLIVRKAADELRLRLGQAVVIENRPGSNSIIAAGQCARAAPDGYTACTLNVDALATNPNMFKNLPYDPDKDFRPVASLYYLLGSLFTKKSFPVNNVQELRLLSVKNPGTMNWGTLGNNTVTDISRMWLLDAWKAKVTGIPYRGGPPIFAALTAGEIERAGGEGAGDAQGAG